MSRISQRFHSLRQEGRPALVAYVMAGDPDLDATARIVQALEEGGADIIELGVPFTDPLADGPVIQAANERALAGGTDLDGILHFVQGLRQSSEIPILLMTYYNPLLRQGLDEIARRVAEAGVDGVLVTDLPPEEAAPWKAAANRCGLDTIFLLAPTSTDERIRIGAEWARGFVYCVSRAGVTGERADIGADLEPLLRRIRAATDTPIAVGFGISTPEQASTVAGWADGVVVGSAFVNRIARSKEAAQSVGEFAVLLRQALDGGASRGAGSGK